MKIPALIGLFAITLAPDLVAGPSSGVAIGNAGAFRPASGVAATGPTMAQPVFLRPTLPIVYQPYGAAYASPIYFGSKAASVPSPINNPAVPAFSPVTPLVVPPPPSITRPVTIY